MTKFNSHILSVLLFITSCVYTYGQSKESDKFFAKGVNAFNKGLYNEAIDYFEKSKNLDDEQLPEEDCRNGYSKAWLAYCYYKIGNEAKAKELAPYFYFIPPIDRRLTVESDTEAAIANRLILEGSHKEALPHALKCFELEEKILGKENTNYIGSCYLLSDIYYNLNDLPNTLKYCRLGLKVLDIIGIEISPINFDLIANLINCYILQDRFIMAKAELNKLKQLALKEEYPQNKIISYARTKMISAQISLQENDNHNAVSEAKSGFKLLSASYQNIREDYVIYYMRDCIGFLCMAGKYNEATSLLETSLPAQFAPEHEGLLLEALGNLAENPSIAKNYLEKSAELLEDTKYTDDYYSVMTAIANINYNTGDKKEALTILEAICKYYESRNIHSPIYHSALILQGDLYDNLGNYFKADEYYNTALGLLSCNKDNPDYLLTFIKRLPIILKLSDYSNLYNASTFNNYILELNTSFNKFNYRTFIQRGISPETVIYTILPFYTCILSNAPRIPGLPLKNIEAQLSDLIYNYLEPNLSLYNQTTLNALSALAHTEYLLGFPDKAISIMNQIIDISDKKSWPNDGYHHDMAYYQYNSGDFQGAYENFRIGFDFFKEKLLSSYKWMTLEERSKLTYTSIGNISVLPQFAAMTPKDKRYAELAYNALLFSKGLLLNSSIELSKLLQEKGDNEAMSLLSKWRDINRQLQIAGSTDNANLSRLQAEANQIESQLVAKSKIFGDYTKKLIVDYGDVQKGLENNDVAIEFCSYAKSAKCNHYGVLILTKTESPRYVEIGDDSAWNHIDINEECYKNSEYFDLFFHKIKNYIPAKNEGKVYFSANGIFNNIAIENMPGSEEYNFRRLSSTRELAFRNHSEKRVKAASFFGGISYGLGKVKSYYKSSGKAKRDAIGFLQDLPGTAIETENISNLLSKKINVTKYLAAAASEENLKNLSGKSIDLLHIATHGFFDQQQNVNFYTDNPLLSSGLYMAGAQNTLWEIDNMKMKEDGILTSQEIATLDLRGLKLAVLSACETGLGIINSDGVFGLQRGFKQAGAESIMMSLWKVDDEATQTLMTEFYKNLLKGENQYDALKNAQAVIRKQYPDPKYWAAFILIDADNKLNFY